MLGAAPPPPPTSNRDMVTTRRIRMERTGAISEETRRLLDQVERRRKQIDALTGVRNELAKAAQLRVELTGSAEARASVEATVSALYGDLRRQVELAGEAQGFARATGMISVERLSRLTEDEDEDAAAGIGRSLRRMEEQLEEIAAEPSAEAPTPETIRSVEMSWLALWSVLKDILVVITFIQALLPDSQIEQLRDQVLGALDEVERRSSHRYLARPATLRGEPSSDAGKVARVRPGTRVFIADRVGRWAKFWYKVDEESGEIGQGWAYFPSLRFKDNAGQPIASTEAIGGEGEASAR